MVKKKRRVLFSNINISENIYPVNNSLDTYIVTLSTSEFHCVHLENHITIQTRFNFINVIPFTADHLPNPFSFNRLLFSVVLSIILVKIIKTVMHVYKSTCSIVMNISVLCSSKQMMNVSTAFPEINLTWKLHTIIFTSRPRVIILNVAIL